MRSRQEALALYAEYQAGASLAALGARLGVSHEAVRLLFIHYGLPRRSHSPDPQVAHRVQHRVQQERVVERVVELYKQHGTIAAVVEELRGEVPQVFVSKIISEIPNREAYRRRGSYQSASRKKLISDLRKAAEHAGEPLSGMTYQEIAPKLGIAAYDTIIKHFSNTDNPCENPSESPWQAALKAAGVKGNPPRGKRAGTISPDQCIASVMRCFRDSGGVRVSYEDYRTWARANGRISGATVRKRVGWNSAAEEALARLHA